MKDLLSIIVPVYNCEKYLARCVESIIKQKYHNFELILIDDGSTDNSLFICKKYESKDNRVKVYHQTNSGVAKARNFGILKANGDYIAFVDSDDYVEEEMYTILIQDIKRHSAQMAICSWMIHNEITSINKTAYVGETQVVCSKTLKLHMSYNNDYFGGGYPWNRVIDFSYFRENNFDFPLIDESLNSYEDKLWLMNILDAIQNVSINNYVGYNYIIRTGSLTRKPIRDIGESRCKAFMMMYSNLQSTNCLTEQFISTSSHIIANTLWRMLVEEEFILFTKCFTHYGKNIEFKSLGTKDRVKYVIMKLYSLARQRGC